MNTLFSLFGDALHLASIFIILKKIWGQKNCRGISLKTQCLYVAVFLTRYLDIFYNFSDAYQWSMKIVFIVTSCLVVYLMKFKRPICSTYDKTMQRMDNFNVLYIVIPCFVCALVFNYFFSVMEILWTFSIYLEAVAIVPQLIVVHKWAHENEGFVENLTSHYVFALGGYRAMYLLNWIYRLATEVAYRNWIVWIAGVVQTLIYCDFFYYYLRAKFTGETMKLPTV